MIQSPLNYTGGKFKLLPQILPHFPIDIDTFVDLFCGGCNVGINVQAKNYLYNDECAPLINLYRVMQTIEPECFVKEVETLINEYGLSDVKAHGYDFYNCNSAEGLGSYNRDNYIRMRNDFNSLKDKNTDYYIRLYVLIVYAFNNQIRFNRREEFNLPPGKRDFNQKMHDKVYKFIAELNKQNAKFTQCDFRELDTQNLTEKDFVYADPPYLITCASYNEQGGWTKQDENDLLEFLDELDSRNIKFALSNVLETKGRENLILKNWIESKPNYKMINLNYSYNNANYQRQNKEKTTKEILVIN